MVRKKSGTIYIKWVRSGIALPRQQRKVVASLGLSRLNQVVERPDTTEIRGAVAKVPHLLQVVSAPEAPPWTAIPDYVIVAKEAAPVKKEVKAERAAKPAPSKAAQEAQPEASAAPADKPAPRKRAAARKEKASEPAKAAAAKDQEEKPRKRRVAGGKESKAAKKGDK